MTIQHYEVLPHDSWTKIAAKLCNPSATATQRNVFAQHLATASQKTVSSAIHPGEVLHYNTDKLPVVAPIPTPPKAMFSVVGNAILDPSGKRFVPIGANVAPTIIPGPYGFTQIDGKSAAGHVHDAELAKWNTVRVTVPPPGDGVTMDQTVAGTKSLIDEYTARKIVCIVEYHSTVKDAPITIAGHEDTRLFWSKLMALVKGNTYVWANVVNEPCTQDAGWYEFSVNCVNMIRFYDSDMIIVCDMANNGQGSAATIPDMVKLASLRNVVLSWHNYGAIIRDAKIGSDSATYNAPNVGWFLRPDPNVPSDIALVKQWLTVWAEMIKALPVIIGECGFDWNAAAKRNGTVPNGYLLERTAAYWSLENFTRYGFGMLAWHGTEGNVYSLRQSDRSVFYDTLIARSEMGDLLAQATGV